MNAPPPPSTQSFVDALYTEFLQRGVSYFFPESRLVVNGPAEEYSAEVTYPARDSTYQFDWLGLRYTLVQSGQPLSPDQKRLLKGIGLVLSTRYRLLQKKDLAAQGFRLFRGQPEDRYVSAFLERAPHLDPQSAAETPDRISSVIEVMRVSALTTYENRRIVTGVLLFGPLPDSCHDEPGRPADALPYTSALTSIRSFHRLSDGLQTMALVDRDGLLVELVDVQNWARPYAAMDLPVPSSARYEAHSRATLCGGHICLVLTPNGEIKIFSQGTQTFRFLDGRWMLTDAMDKYQRWCAAIGDGKLAECLFTAGLNMMEERRGGLFVVLDDATQVEQLVLPGDLVNQIVEQSRLSAVGTKDQLHYLLRGRRVVDLPLSILETVARIDGAIVLGRDSQLLAFGAILRNYLAVDIPQYIAEGSRTTAAIGASRLGKVLKISEDGLMSFYAGGELVWEM